MLDGGEFLEMKRGRKTEDRRKVQESSGMDYHFKYGTGGSPCLEGDM